MRLDSSPVLQNATLRKVASMFVKSSNVHMQQKRCLRRIFHLQFLRMAPFCRLRVCRTTHSGTERSVIVAGRWLIFTSGLTGFDRPRAPPPAGTCTIAGSYPVRHRRTRPGDVMWSRVELHDCELTTWTWITWSSHSVTCCPTTAWWQKSMRLSVTLINAIHRLTPKYYRTTHMQRTCIARRMLCLDIRYIPVLYRNGWSNWAGFRHTLGVFYTVL